MIRYQRKCKQKEQKSPRILIHKEKGWGGGVAARDYPLLRLQGVGSSKWSGLGHTSAALARQTRRKGKLVLAWAEDQKLTEKLAFSLSILTSRLYTWTSSWKNNFLRKHNSVKCESRSRRQTSPATTDEFVLLGLSQATCNPSTGEARPKDLNLRASLTPWDWIKNN